jgi:hypothetical protein
MLDVLLPGVRGSVPRQPYQNGLDRISNL